MRFAAQAGDLLFVAVAAMRTNRAIRPHARFEPFARLGVVREDRLRQVRIHRTPPGSNPTLLTRLLSRMPVASSRHPASFFVALKLLATRLRSQPGSCRGRRRN